MTSSERSFIPAAGHDFALPLYDPLTSLLGARARRQVLIERAQLSAGQRVLDIGCGTGSLAIALQRAQPQVEVTALDPDPRALGVAQRKAQRANAHVRFDRGFGDALPYAERTYDRVFSSFMLHHLERPQQQRLLAEVLRVLVPGGSLHLIDFARADHGGLFGQNLQGAEHVERDLRAATFVDVRVQPEPRWLWQPVMYCSGRRPIELA
jgi:ubiquinone/menaquinone biosynthesis C-methylase UbiE